MSTVTKSPFARPTSVMSLLSDQMESSHIDHFKSQPIEFKPISNRPSNISSSAPTHRNSIPCIGFSSVVPHLDSMLRDDARVLNESDLSSPQLPPKRLCHSSTNDSIARPIPIKVNTESPFHNNPDPSSHFYCNGRHSRMSCSRPSMATKTTQRNPCNFPIRPIIFPHYKKSAFTPTRSLNSPQTTSSDYSISPDIESPIHRPTSVTSSGFNDCSQQSLLIDPNYSPDSNQMSTCATIVNTSAPDGNTGVFPRCHSQPCDANMLRNLNNRSVIVDAEKICTCHESSCNYSSQIHTPLKRRYPSLRHVRSISQSESTSAHYGDSSIHCHCNKPTPNSAETSPRAGGSVFTVPKRDGYFFGNGRNYLISLPRIASSPPPTSLQVDSQTNLSQNHRQRVGSNSSSLSTSTTTDTNTPTVISSNPSAIQRISLSDSINFMKDSAEDIDMDDDMTENRTTKTFPTESDSEEPGIISSPLSSGTLWSDLTNYMPVSVVRTSTSTVSDDTSELTTKSYSTTSDATSNISYSIQSESSRSEFRDPDDPPEIGFCFSQLNNGGQDSMLTAYDDGHASFQALDLDQIELD